MAVAACDWPLVWPAECRELAGAPASDAVTAMAIDLLWNWSGRRFGVCAVRVELVHDPLVCGCPSAAATTYAGRGLGPVRGGRGGGGSGSPWQPVLLAGVMVNVVCGCGFDPCACSGSTVHDQAVVVLPGPVARVDRVLIDGVELPATAWQVRPGGGLVRLDGQVWPHEGLAVEYGRGVAVPVGGQVAAGVLAWELAKALECPEDCALPQRIQAVTRQGVSVAILDQFADLGEGRTGIWLIDSWVASVTLPREGGSVLSPDLWCRPSAGARWRLS